LPEALREKQEAVSTWQEITALMRSIQWSLAETFGFAQISANYGLLLSRIIEAGWRVMALGRELESRQVIRLAELQAAISSYDRAWDDYRALALDPLCPSLYRGHYFNLPGAPEEPGLDITVDYYRGLMTSAVQSGAPVGAERCSQPIAPPSSR
jgi:hypothetical protein